jgi:hypothetical protein
MKPEQFEQIVAAILSGKYSWACVLILRFAGYNPLHYLPYRTYRRLIKDNDQTRFSSGFQKHHRDKDPEPSAAKSSRFSEKRHSRQFKDLSYLEAVDKKTLEVCGGTLLAKTCADFYLAECGDFSLAFVKHIWV